MSEIVSIQFGRVLRFTEERIYPEVESPEVREAITYRANGITGTMFVYTFILPLLAYQAVGGSDDAGIPLASAWLLYDLASDIFDDIQDQDGKDRPWNTLSPDRAMLTGVGMLFAADLALSYLQADTNATRAIWRGLARTGLRAVHGQARLVTKPELRSYFRHIVAKSGQIFATIAWAGGRLRTENPVPLRALYDYGMALGMLVQLRDDCFDLTPTQLTSDLSIGQFTLPILYGLSQHGHPLHERLQELVSRRHDMNHKDSAELVNVLHQLGVYSFTTAMAKAYEQKALRALKIFPESSVHPLKSYVTHVFESLQGA